MSRIGKKPILIPPKVEVKIEGQKVTIKGPKGEISQEVPDEILIEKKENKIHVSLKKKTKQSRALWGLWRALLENDVKGVTLGFEKKLEIRGVGYRAALEADRTVKLEVGFSHPIKLKIPQGIEVSIEKNIVTVSGIQKQKVGEFAAKLRKIKPVEPYKGKGIRYLGEKVRKKEGKKVAAATA
ncbi:50S ribosomal protein L6 [bacterium]|nr:50S ribosomal protein L6 [bacterium]